MRAQIVFTAVALAAILAVVAIAQSEVAAPVGLDFQLGGLLPGPAADRTPPATPV